MRQVVSLIQKPTSVKKKETKTLYFLKQYLNILTYALVTDLNTLRTDLLVKTGLRLTPIMRIEDLLRRQKNLSKTKRKIM